MAEPPAAAARAARHLIAGDGLGEEGGGGGGTVVVLHPQDLALAQHAAQRQLPGSHSLKDIAWSAKRDVVVFSYSYTILLRQQCFCFVQSFC